MDWHVQLEQGALGIGVFIIIFSLVPCIKRTEEAKAMIFCWQKRPQLTRQEFIINRLNSGLTMVGAFIQLIYRTFLSGASHV